MTTAPYSACLAGFKGAVFLRAVIAAGHAPHRVLSYRQRGDRSAAYDVIAELCANNGIILESRSATPFATDEPCFFVGWQFRTHQIDPGHVVFHDSLLPSYRGFAPTVAALIAGDAEIGVTLFRPDTDIDSGPILAQRRWRVNYPCKLEDALRTQAKKMAELALTFLSGDTAVPGTAQDHVKASYSIWRDETDYRIDWSRPARDICRFIDAVGYPFAGASTCVQDKRLRIVAATELATDLAFVQRHAGKVWRIDGDAPIVICGQGMLRIDRITDDAGAPIVIDALRTRFC